MANFIYNVAKAGLADGSIDWDTHTIKVLLLESDAGENKDNATITGLLVGSTELTSTGYARQTLAGKAVTQDDPNDRAELDATDPTFTNVQQLAAETITGFVVYRHVTNDTDSIPILHVDTATGLPITPNGSNIAININAEGLIQLADA